MDLRKMLAHAAVSPPSPPDTPVTGYPTNGNPGAGTPAGQPGAYWFHQLAEELRNVVVGAGLTPDHTDLDQLWSAILATGPELPLGALHYPTIDTADHRANITGASATAGGTVSIPADVEISLGQEVTTGKTGRLRRVATAAWTSPDLDASSTYYLRAYLNAGVWTPYVQKGTDSDTVPAGLKGTPGGGSGGGFDSTVLDVLLAKVATGTAGSTPTVTKLANAARMQTVASVGVAFARALDWTALAGSTLSLNWARAPAISAPVLAHVRAARLDQVALGVDITTGSGNLQMQGVREASISSRYSRSLEYVFDDSVDTDGYGDIKWIVEA